MFIAALFVIAKNWKQHKCPSTIGQINKLWYIHTVEYYSAVKENEFWNNYAKWKKNKVILYYSIYITFLKNANSAFGSDGCVYYLECVGFMDIYRCLIKCTL